MKKKWKNAHSVQESKLQTLHSDLTRKQATEVEQLFIDLKISFLKKKSKQQIKLKKKKPNRCSR